MKTNTRFAIAAAVTALMSSTALAADLGGNCCADLEERIAELEATTVKKGNRKINLTISGWIGQQVMFWDDGTQSDMYIGDGGNIFSRFRFTGTAKISPTLTAGFTYEFGANATAIGSMNQLNGGDKLGGSGVGGGGCGGSTTSTNITTASTIGCATIRDTTVYLRDTRLGMVKIGQGSTATDNLVLIDLAGLDIAATPDVALYMGGMLLRGNNGLFGGSTNNAWASAIRGHESWDTNRREHILYETPTLAGFTLQAAVAADNYWDVALRYAGEFNGVRIAAGIGYQEDTDFNGNNQLFNQGGALCVSNCDVKSKEVKGSASILHVPTGLFLTGAAGQREISGSNSIASGAYVGPDVRFFWLAAGVSQNFFGIGKTVLFGEYGEHKGGLAEQAFLGNVSNFCFAASGCDSTVTSWGLGVNQYIDAAAMQVFATYKSFSLDTAGFVGIHFANAHFAGIVIGDLFNRRAKHLAGTAPRSPKIDQHRLAALQNLRRKIGFRELQNISGHE